ncbi:hypothetical protein, partial [Sinosporangium siamense]
MNARTIGGEWLFKYYWSFDTVPAASDFEQYAKAVMICASGDGSVTPGERSWIMGYFAALGCTEDLLDLLATYTADEPIEAVLAQSKPVNVSTRALIYDAIRACAADGALHPEEIARIRHMNHVLGLPGQVVDDWLAYHTEEDDIRLRRVEMTWPDPDDKP